MFSISNANYVDVVFERTYYNQPQKYLENNKLLRILECVRWDSTKEILVAFFEEEDGVRFYRLDHICHCMKIDLFPENADIWVSHSWLLGWLNSNPEYSKYERVVNYFLPET